MLRDRGGAGIGRVSPRRELQRSLPTAAFPQAHSNIVRVDVDVTDAGAIAAAARVHGDLGVLVNCIGKTAKRRLWQDA